MKEEEKDDGRSLYEGFDSVKEVISVIDSQWTKRHIILDTRAQQIIIHLSQEGFHPIARVSMLIRALKYEIETGMIYMEEIRKEKEGKDGQG